MEIVAILSYLIVAGLVVFFSLKLSDYVDLLDKKTNLSGAFLGGILLAAVTSLPELFTSLTATAFIHDNHLVLGNILGSDLFNLCLAAIIYIGFFKKLMSSKVSKSYLWTYLFMGCLYTIVTLASFVIEAPVWFFKWFNPLSIAIFAIYALAIAKTPAEEEAEDKETDSKLTVKQIVILFIVFSFLLIGASIGMTYLVDWISSLFNLGATFAGALFLGVATSLPEMTATINLCKKKNYTAVYGNILGSNVFNFLILGLADILGWSCKDSGGNWISIYKIDQSSFLLLICGAFSIIISLLTYIFKVKGIAKDNKKWHAFYIICGFLLVASYVVFLILSNIDLGLSFAPIA